MRTVDEVTVEAAVAAVASAAAVAAMAQGRLMAGHTLTKSDDSPVTIADFAAQAVVCQVLADRLGDVAVVGEETPDDLVGRGELLAGVKDVMTAAVGGGFAAEVGVDEVLRAISFGDADAAGGRYWTLDPIDGTKGFMRGDHYAIALALIDDGEVLLGVLGCPNLSASSSVDTSADVLAASETVGEGAILVGVDGSATVRAGVTGTGVATPIRVADPLTLADARLCESVESGHSDQESSAEIACLLGIETEPYRIDSQCKYAAVARGEASIYLRLPTRADYREKIWDHAAGKFVVECAGGVVTDVDGVPLDFGRGDRLSANRGVVATSGRFHDEVIAAIAAAS